MSLAEFSVVYLSSGAPFGVLVFFSKRSNSRLRSIVASVAAAVFWPLFAISWSHHRLLQQRQKAGHTPHPILEIADLTHGSLITEYVTLTRALNDARSLDTPRSSELFEFAGHSNPELAAVCAQRRRDLRLDLRQKASAQALIDHLRTQNSLSSNYVRSVAEYCTLLGDVLTADLIERIFDKRPTDQLPIAADPVNADSVQLAA